MTYPQQSVFYDNGVVVACVTIFSSMGSAAGPDNAEVFVLSPPNNAIQPGWIVGGTAGAPIFTAPTAA